MERVKYTMEQENLKNLLSKGAEAFSVHLDDARINCFLRYKELIKEWNEKINLTAIEDDREIIIKHYIDSISILPYFKNEDKKFIDIGTGAGFPGIPVKIVYDKINVTLIDSLEKRINFLNLTTSELGLTGIKAVHGRAEDYGKNPEYREKFDISVARAVSNLPVLLEYCMPFVKLGGLFIAMKGSNIDELEASKKALDILGGKIEDVVELNLPFSEIKRNIILVRKYRQTPTKYPRKAGKPSKDPLI